VSYEDILDEGGQIYLSLGPDFPAEDVRQLSTYLADLTYLIPGFVSSETGFLSLETLIYTQQIQQAETVLVLDRNVITRMAQIARTGTVDRSSAEQVFAASLMALAQSVDWMIDPTLAYCELAHRVDNETALDELAWFRVADDARARVWIDLALGRVDEFQFPNPADREDRDFSREHWRWVRNYAVCLKIAKLELERMKPADRAIALLDWMVADFFVAGPAALFAIFYFAPQSPRGGMIKHLRSDDRERAIAGVKNAAWDITYLSEFVRGISESDFKTRRIVMATADRNLAQVASLLIPKVENNDAEASFYATFCKFWDKRSAKAIATKLVESIGIAANRKPPGSETNAPNPIPSLIKSGEKLLRSQRFN
jgi:hypothetical protein